MNYCTSCGSELLENAAFCPNCGAKVGSVNVSDTQSVDPVDENIKNEPVTGEEVAEKLTHTFSNAKETVQRSSYFNYFVETLKRPTSSIGSNSTSHGWIQLVVFAAMTALSVYAAVKSTIRLGLNEMGITSYFGVEL